MDIKLEYDMLNEPEFFSKTYATLALKEADIKNTKDRQE